MGFSKHQYSIKDDYSEAQELAIVPVKDFFISDRYKISDITIYPIDSFDPKELTRLKIDNDFLEIEESFFKSTIIVFPIKMYKEHIFKNFTIEERQSILSYVISKTEEVLNIFKYIYCNLDKTSLLIQRAGYIDISYSGILIYYPEMDTFDLIKDKYTVNTKFISQGLSVNLDEIDKKLNDYISILKKDCGEIGNIIKHALRLYSNIIEANNLTNKYVQSLSLIEYLSNPYEYEKMKTLKGPIIAFSVNNKKEYYKAAERFRLLTSFTDKNQEQIGYRTNIVHNGNILESLVSKPYEAELLIGELQSYICNYLEQLFIYYKEDWESFKEFRQKQYEKVIKNNSGFEEKSEVDTLVIIDFPFFNDALREVYNMYPQHSDKKFDMGTFLINCMNQVGIERKGYKIPFQFFIESEDEIYNGYGKKNILDYDNLGLDTKYGEANIIITKLNKNYKQEFRNMLSTYTLERNKVLFPRSKFNNIILISDRNEIPHEFFKEVDRSVKNLYLGRLDNYRSTTHLDFIWFDIQYLFFNTLGIDMKEEICPNFIFDFNGGEG